MSNPAHLGIGKQSAIFDPRDSARADCSCFKRVQIVNQPRGGTLIGWELKEGFRSKSAFNFYVDWGYAGTDEWKVLNTDPIVDSCTYVDLLQRQYDQTPHYYYRVRLVLPTDINPETGHCKVFTSTPQQANGLWSKMDWLLAREICRKEYLYQRKRTNMTAVGHVLKRKRWGKACIRCTDFDTGEVEAQDCPVCYGTGFEGGYYKAQRLVITLDPPEEHGFAFTEQEGFDHSMNRAGRCVNYPHLDTDDVYVRDDNGERFWIKKIEPIVEVGAIPIVVKPKMKLAPATDIIYTVPLAGNVSSASSDSSCGANTPPDEETW